MLLNRLLIKAVAPVPKIEKFKTYLFVAPHPDDIEIAVGRTVARLAREGKDVYYLVCTDASVLDASFNRSGLRRRGRAVTLIHGAAYRVTNCQ